AAPRGVFELLLVQDKYGVIVGGHDRDQLMLLEGVGRGEAALEEGGPVDVVVLGAGEDELLGDQPLGGGPVLGEVAREEGADGVGVGLRHPSSLNSGHESGAARSGV